MENQATKSATGNPMNAIAMIVLSAQAGVPNVGKTIEAACTDSHAATAYAAATRSSFLALATVRNPCTVSPEEFGRTLL